MTINIPLRGVGSKDVEVTQTGDYLKVTLMAFVMMSIIMSMISLSTMVFQLFYFEVKLSQLVKPGQCSQFHQPTCFQLEIQVRWTPCLVNGHVHD